jgi:hypothetical protein
LQFAPRRSKVFEKSGEKWFGKGASSDSAEDATNLAVLDVLATSRDLTIQEFIDGPSSALLKNFESPTLQLSFSGSPTQTIQLHKQNNRVLARTTLSSLETGTASPNFEPTVYVLSPDTLSAFENALGILFSRTKR